MPQPAAGAGSFCMSQASKRQKHTSECCRSGGSSGCFCLALCLTIHLFQWLITTGGGDTEAPSVLIASAKCIILRKFMGRFVCLL